MAVDDGVDSHFPFDNDPGEDGGVVVFEGLLGGETFSGWRENGALAPGP